MTRASILVGSTALTLVGCGNGSHGPAPQPPAEVWPAGIYAAEVAGHTLYLSIDGHEVQPPPGLEIRSQTWTHHGALELHVHRQQHGNGTLTLYPGLRLRVAYPPIDLTVPVRLVQGPTAHG